VDVCHTVVCLVITQHLIPMVTPPNLVTILDTHEVAVPTVAKRLLGKIKQDILPTSFIKMPFPLKEVVNHTLWGGGDMFPLGRTS
jgi:hypothetical protein